MTGIGQKTISLKIPVNWLYGIIVLAVGLIVAFVFVPVDKRPILVFAAAVVAGAAGLTTAINNVDQRASQAAKTAELAKEARVAAALAFVYRWNDPTFFHCKRSAREISEYFKTTPSINDQIAYLRSDMGRFANLIDMMNMFEVLFIAIDNNTIDEDTAKRFFRSVALEYWHQMEGVIKKIRAERNNARLYKEYETLYTRWKD